MSLLQVPPVSAVSDVLALWGKDGWLTPPLAPVVLPGASLLGRVRTLQMVVADHGPGLAPVYDLLSRNLTGCIVVVAGATDLPAAVWGEILATAAKVSGAIGVLIDGSVRDRPALSSTGLPIYARGECVVGPAGRAHVVAVDEPVMIGGVAIAAGEAIVIDDTGCVRLSMADEIQVLDAARRYTAAEEQVVAALATGMSLTEAYLLKKIVVDELKREYARTA